MRHLLLALVLLCSCSNDGVTRWSIDTEWCSRFTNSSYGSSCDAYCDNRPQKDGWTHCVFESGYARTPVRCKTKKHMPLPATCKRQ